MSGGGGGGGGGVAQVASWVSNPISKGISTAVGAVSPVAGKALGILGSPVEAAIAAKDFIVDAVNPHSVSPLGTPPTPTPTDEATQGKMDSAAAGERGRKGRASTLLAGGGRGDVTTASTSRRVLLGS